MKPLNILSFNILFFIQLIAQDRVDITKKYLNSDIDKNLNLTQLVHNQPFIIIYLDPECPITQKYTRQLEILKNQFPKISFLGIFTKWTDWQDIQNFKNEYPLSYEVFQDTKNRLIKKLKGRVVPEVFFFNEKGILLYRGAIDNWFYALGKHRPEPTECYLEDAILSYLNHQDIKIKKTNAIGCVIEY